jgi:hypothetical protein
MVQLVPARPLTLRNKLRTVLYTVQSSCDDCSSCADIRKESANLQHTVEHNSTQLRGKFLRSRYVSCARQMMWKTVSSVCERQYQRSVRTAHRRPLASCQESRRRPCLFIRGDTQSFCDSFDSDRIVDCGNGKWKARALGETCVPHNTRYTIGDKFVDNFCNNGRKCHTIWKKWLKRVGLGRSCL